jgi:hypothetical protein
MKQTWQWVCRIAGAQSPIKASNHLQSNSCPAFLAAHPCAIYFLIANELSRRIPPCVVLKQRKSPAKSPPRGTVSFSALFTSSNVLIDQTRPGLNFPCKCRCFSIQVDIADPCSTPQLLRMASAHLPKAFDFTGEVAIVTGAGSRLPGTSTTTTSTH